MRFEPWPFLLQPGPLPGRVPAEQPGDPVSLGDSLYSMVQEKNPP